MLHVANSPAAKLTTGEFTLVYSPGLLIAYTYQTK